MTESEMSSQNPAQEDLEQSGALTPEQSAEPEDSLAMLNDILNSASASEQSSTDSAQMSGNELPEQRQTVSQGDSGNWKSAVLESLTDAQKPPKDVACATCPLSSWYILSGSGMLRCYCGKMMRETYDTRLGRPTREYISACDARDEALAEAAEEDEA